MPRSRAARADDPLGGAARHLTCHYNRLARDLTAATSTHVDAELGKIFDLQPNEDGDLVPSRGWRGRLNSAVAKAKAEFRRKNPTRRTRAAVLEAQDRIEVFQRRRFQRSMLDIANELDDPDDVEDRIAAGLIADIDGPEESFQKENRKYAELDLARKHFDDTVAALAAAAFLKRTNLGKLHKVVRSRYGIVRRRARTIADDQSEKFAGNLDQVLFNAAGIEEYTWGTQQDERVRPRHEELEQSGERIKVNGPGVEGEGHPGDPPNCRCFMVPVGSSARRTRRRSLANTPTN